MGARRAHPRSRGENRHHVSRRWCCKGSSPLTRGKRCSSAARRATAGLIPAHAGKTPPRRGPCRTGGAHPRSRGENPPRPTRRRSPCGLIPAHAGKTCTSRQSRLRRRAHPRSRGENPMGLSTEEAEKGSSPLTRGKPAPHRATREIHGLIPAHAGKTMRTRPAGLGRRAHPRSRGENPSMWPPPTRRRGSSPLTRGKPAGQAVGVRRRGLIPAHAGKTGSADLRIIGQQAHPRSRGENVAALSSRRRATGSSPLTRGKRHRPRRVRGLRGLIPAHAGKTRSTAITVRMMGAHPRSRGENLD